MRATGDAGPGGRTGELNDGRRWIFVVLVLMVIEIAGWFEHAMVLSGLPFFAEVFDVDIAAVSWIITIFVLTGAGSAVVAGRLGDMYGRKRIVLILLTISITGSLLTIVFGTFPAMLVGRALQGTSAGIMPLLIGIAREALPEKRIAVTVSVMTAVAAITGGIGVFVAGLFIDAGAWRAMFAASAALCLLSLVAGWLVLPSAQRTAPGTIDWLGATLLAPALITLLYGLSEAKDLGVLHPVVVLCTAAGLILLGMWTWWELRTPEPLVDLRLLLSPRTAKLLLIMVLAGLAPLSAYTVYSPLLALSPADLPIGLGMSATTYGVTALAGAGVTLATSPLAGVLARRYGAAVALIVGIGLMIAHFAGLMVPALNKSFSGFVVLVVFATVGTSFIAASIYNLIIEAVPSESTSEYVGIAQVVRNVTMAVGTVVVSRLISSSVVPGTTAPTIGAWNVTMLYGIVLSLAVVAVAVVVRAQRSPARAGRPAAGQAAVAH